MDDTEDDSRYEYGSSNRKKITFRGNSYSKPLVSLYSDDDDKEEDDDDNEEEEVEEEEEENEELGDEEDDHNGKIYPSNGYQIDRKDPNDFDDGTESEADDEEESDNDGSKNRSGGPDSTKHPRKRKLKSLISSYEFAPRVPPAGPMKPPSLLPPPSSSRNSLTDWTEQETVALLDSWGDRYLGRGRKILRSEEWREVAEKVSEVSESDRTETQCRNRLDTLKKKYKREKLVPGNTSKWPYFKKMDLLLSTPPSMAPHQHQKNPKLEPWNPGLSCGLDSGEYVFMNPRVYLNRANGLDEMRDSPGNSESDNDDDDDEEGEGSDGLPPKKRKKRVDEEGSTSTPSSSSSFRMLANSIKKFCEVYEKIEASRMQQMADIEKTRMEFQRDLEVQRKQIMERTHSKIAKIRRGEDDDDDNDDNDDDGDEAVNGDG